MSYFVLYLHDKELQVVLKMTLLNKKAQGTQGKKNVSERDISFLALKGLNYYHSAPLICYSGDDCYLRRV